MQEILYRGKRKVNNEWVEGFPFIDRKNQYKIKWYDSRYGSSKTSDVFSETVGQFSGVWDNSHKKIFDGDIVEYDDGVHKFRGKIVFENGAFGVATEEVIPVRFQHSCYNDNFISLWEILWNQDYADYNIDCIKVIGNIHDNPDLLKTTS